MIDWGYVIVGCVGAIPSTLLGIAALRQGRRTHVQTEKIERSVNHERTLMIEEVKRLNELVTSLASKRTEYNG